MSAKFDTGQPAVLYEPSPIQAREIRLAKGIQDKAAEGDLEALDAALRKYANVSRGIPPWNKRTEPCHTALTAGQTEFAVNLRNQAAAM